MPAPATAGERDRLASLFGALVSSADAASGFHPEKAIRTAIVATRLAAAHGLDHAAQADTFYLALVRFLGCTSFAPEAARYGGGDDISVGTVMGLADPDEPVQLIRSVVTGVGRGAPAARRARGVLDLMSDRSAAEKHARAECDVGDALARSIGMPQPVVAAVQDLFERWDGKGHPRRKQGDDIALLARVVAVADIAEIAFTRLGVDAAVDIARRRSGGRFDPRLVRTFCDNGPHLLQGLGATSVWDLFLDTEPPPHCNVTPAVVANYAEAFARAVDLKSVWTAAHSHTVGVVAAATAEAAGMDRATVEQLRISGWLHDLGRVAIPNLVWDKPAALNAAEWEQVRLHAYYTERLLARSALLAPLAPVAGADHERCAGSGYPKSLRSASLDGAARLLAACDVYTALRENRPHRPALDADAAATVLAQEVEKGALDGVAVRRVLDAAGLTARVPTDWPAGLTDREVEVSCAWWPREARTRTSPAASESRIGRCSTTSPTSTTRSA